MTYLLYAVGEIVLVVIGILIAVKIGDINEEKKLNSSAKFHLQILKQDLAKDLPVLQGLLLESKTQLGSLQRLFNQLKRIESIDDRVFNDLTATQIELNYKPRTNGLNLLVNSGELGALSDSLQNQISNYYSSTEHVKDREDISNHFIRDKYEVYLIDHYSYIYGKANEHPFQQEMYADDRREQKPFDSAQFLNDKSLEMLLFGRYYQLSKQIEAYERAVEELQKLTNLIE